MTPLKVNGARHREEATSFAEITDYYQSMDLSTTIGVNYKYSELFKFICYLILLL
jgi:hypothetical protein